MSESRGSAIVMGQDQVKKSGWWRQHHLLIILLSVFVKGVVIAIVVPPWHIHDEPAHVQYVQSIVEDHRLPVFRGAVQDLSQEIGASLQRSAKFGQLYGQLTPTIVPPPTDERANPKRMSKLPAANLAAEYGPLYYVIEAIPYSLFQSASIEQRVLAMRIFSSLLLVVTVFFAYQLALLIRPSLWFASAVAVMVGWQPQAAFIMSGVNNDALFIALSTICLYRLMKMFNGVITPRSVIFTSVLIGLTIMTKQPGWILFPMFLGIMVIRRKTWGTPSWIQWTMLAAVVMFLVGNVWLFRNIIIGSSNGLVGTAQDFSTRFQDQSLSFYLDQIFIGRWLKVLITFWGFFGWSWSNPGPVLPIWAYRTVILLTAVSIIGLVRFFLVGKDQALRRGLWLLTAAWFLLEGLYMALFIHRMLFQGTTDFPTQGRYYFPLLAGLMIMFIMGIENIVPKKYQKMVWTVLPVGMVMLGLYSIYPIIFTFYRTQPS